MRKQRRGIYILAGYILVIGLATQSQGMQEESEFDPFPILGRLDQNRDGHLTVAEVPADAKDFVDGIAAQLGLDQWKTLDLDRLKDKWREAPPPADSQNSRYPAAPGGKEISNKMKLLLQARSLVKNYDANHDGQLQEQETAKLSDHWMKFDANGDKVLTTPEIATGIWQVEYDYRQAESGESQQQAPTKQKPKSTPPEFTTSDLRVLEEIASREPARIAIHEGNPSDKELTLKYARVLMKGYDTNDDQVLDQSEWEKIHGDWAKVDFDHDGRITLDEMAVRFKSLQENRLEKSNPQDREGLPRDLPDVFFKLDKNRDGQIQMHEFTQRWSEEKVRQFRRYDHNLDGLITPAEWLSITDSGD